MKIFTIVFFHFLLFIFSSLIFAQTAVIHKTDSTGVYRLSDVVISATKTSTSTLELANSISIIDSAEIANRNTSSVFELLKNEYGLSFTSQGGPGTLSNIYLRGGSASYTHVLVDGVELNLTSDPNGVYDFAALSSESIERIEVLRGPQSILYGSDALAGVINIITRKGSGSSKFFASGEAGSYNTFNVNAGSYGSVYNFNYAVSLGRTKSDGFSAANKKYGNREKDGFRNDNLTTSLGYRFSDQFKTNLLFRYLDSDADYDQSGIYGDDPTYKFQQEEFSVRNENQINLFSNLWQQNLGVSFTRNIRKYSFDETIINPSASKSLYDGRKFKVDWQNNLNFIKKNTLTVGLDFEIDEAVSEFISYSAFGDFISIFPKNNSSTLGTYIQNQYNFSDQLFASAGIRMDYHDSFGSSFTYRIAPAYLIWQTGTKIKATIGTGYKTPSLFYLYDPAFGNQDLNPEKSLGWDAGIEQFFWNEGLSFGATYFQNNYTDLFGFDSNFRTININKAETNGVEVFTVIKLFLGFEAKLNYTYTNAFDKSADLNDEKTKLIRRPEHKLGGFISFNFSERANANFDWVYVGNRDDLDFSTFPSTRIKLEPYFLLNFAAHYKLYDFLRFNMRIVNILNSDYEEVFGYGTAGISIYGGISFSID